MIKNLTNQIKIYQIGIVIAGKKSVEKRGQKMEVTVILGDSIMKDVEGWERTDKSSNIIKSFQPSVKRRDMLTNYETKSKNIILH